MTDIVTLAYDLKKAKAEVLCPDNLYKGMTAAYIGGNIGVVSNKITTVWNADVVDQSAIDSVKRLCYINNQVIDFAKTLWKVEPPQEINEEIKSFTKHKLPYFFIYAKDKTIDQVEPPNDSTMNRIMKHIPDPKKMLYCKTVGKMDYRMLMNKKAPFMIDDDNVIIKVYDKWAKKIYEFNKDNENIGDDDLYVYKRVREGILNECHGFGVDFVVNTLVAFYYTVRTTSSKKTLWSCFGKEIVDNLRENTKDLGNICPICGKRFKPRDNANTTYCSDGCCKEGNRENTKAKYER